MNRIDFSNLGGFPLEQDTLNFLQNGYSDLFEAIAKMAGDKTILSGVEVVGSAVSSGWISYNGEILKFIGGATGAGVIIQEATQDALFEDGSTKPVYKTRTATIGTPAAFPFSDLKRVDTLAAQVASLAAVVAKMNKQYGYVSYTGSQIIGDVGFNGSTGVNDSVINVFIPDQGANNYIVAGSLIAISGTGNANNNVTYTILNKTNGSFQIALHEVAQTAQNLRFEFAIIKNY